MLVLVLWWTSQFLHIFPFCVQCFMCFHFVRCSVTLRFRQKIWTKIWYLLHIEQVCFLGWVNCMFSCLVKCPLLGFCLVTFSVLIFMSSLSVVRLLLEGALKVYLCFCAQHMVELSALCKMVCHYILYVLLYRMSPRGPGLSASMSIFPYHMSPRGPGLRAIMSIFILKLDWYFGFKFQVIADYRLII